MNEIVFTETMPGVMSAAPSRTERARIRRMMAARVKKRRQLGDSVQAGVMFALIAAVIMGGHVLWWMGVAR